MSLKQEDEDEDLKAFLAEGLDAFGGVHLDEMPSRQEVWMEMLKKIEAAAPVPDFLRTRMKTNGLFCLRYWTCVVNQLGRGTNALLKH